MQQLQLFISPAVSDAHFCGGLDMLHWFTLPYSLLNAAENAINELLYSRVSLRTQCIQSPADIISTINNGHSRNALKMSG